MTDRPNVSARGSTEVFEAHRVLTRHDKKMAGVTGFRSMKATTVSSSCTTLAPACLATMAQKTQPRAADVAFCVMRAIVPMRPDRHHSVTARWPGPVAVIDAEARAGATAQLLGDAFGAHRDPVMHSLRTGHSGEWGTAPAVAEGAGLDSVAGALRR